jgi:cyanophycin synthetase
VRLIEIRLLEGPNVFRLEPAVKVELAVGRSRPWHGERMPRGHAGAELGRRIPARDWPDDVVDLVAWARRLRIEHEEACGPVSVHRGADPGHWIVAWPWAGAERAHTIAEAAVDLAGRSVSPLRRVRLTGTQTRLLAAWQARIRTARATPPGWCRDAVRRVPIISISGTNGKSTVTRLVTHILVRAGRRVGTTTSDGILVDERVVEPGDWTGPGGAATILRRSDVEVAVLETARGGIVMRGIGYESNDASILTNISSDHLDLHGVHTLPQLTEVKATVCRITRPDGWVILNADDPLVAATARRVRARVAFFSLDPDGSPVMRRHLAGGGRGYALRDGTLVEIEGGESREIVDVADLPVALGGLAVHNVANALAAAGGARAMGATLAEVADGLRHFSPSADRSPGRMNLFRLGQRIVIVDFAHNEAGIAAMLDAALLIGSGASGRATPVTAIIGTAGDRPTDTLEGIGRVAAERAQRVVIKETPSYLRGRTRESVIDAIRRGIASAGVDADAVPVYPGEAAALESELAGTGARDAGDGRPEAPRIVVLLCHAERDAVYALLDRLGARPVDVAAELSTLSPRLGDRRRG